MDVISPSSLFDCLYDLCCGFHALRLGRNTFLNNICERIDMIHTLENVDRHIFLVEHESRSQSRVGRYT